MKIALRLVVLILLVGTASSITLDKDGSFLLPTLLATTVAGGPFPGPLPQPPQS